MSRRKEEPAMRSEEIQSLAKGLAVIRAFGPETPKLTLAEVARATSLTRAGARRVLLTLIAQGYVSMEDRYFRLQPRILELGYAYLASQPWWRPAQKVVEHLANEFDNPVAAGVVDGDAVTYLAHARPSRFEAFVRSVGTKLPVGISAMGRIILADLPDDALAKRLGEIRLFPLTKATLTDHAHLQQAILEARRRGYALIDQELEVGLRSLAVPIRDRGGRVLAAIGVSSSDPGFTMTSFVQRFLEPLRHASQTISASLPA
ncbi:MAG: helix-turn-helix domain-containing protein [Alphaproteobacteria bacterium]|nr:helix-turn-helix domain-containing protein [Alphaproteobacteria bacterium]